MLLENNPYPRDVRVRCEAESLVAAGYTVEVSAPREKGQPAHERLNGVDVHRFRAITWQRNGAVAMLVEYAVAMIALHAAAVRALIRGATVLHIHNPPDTLFLAGGMFRLAGRRVVFDHHDLGPELVAARFGRGTLELAARATERLTFAVSSHVLAANESHAEIALERGGKAARDLTIVRNGPPSSWTRLPLHVRQGRLPIVRLAYLGTIAQQDGLEGLAEVLALLRNVTPAVEPRLMVIGDGDAKPQFETALKAYGVSASVTITGWLPQQRVPGLLEDADVCVDPAAALALNQRSTMIKVAEYLALGKPVVAYDLRETRRTVQDAAMLVRPGDARAFADAVAMLAADPALRSDLAHRARERARDLTWERSEAALLTTYSSFGLNTPSTGGRP